MSNPAAYADLTQLSQNFAAASGQSFYASAHKLVNSYAQQIASTAQAYAPVRTGALRDSISVKHLSGLTAVIGPNVPYGTYQEFGTGTRGEFGGSVYIIKPRSPGGVLVFNVNGKRVVAREVHHPGIRPHPYMRPAFERVVTPFGQSLAELGGSYVKYGPHAPMSLGGAAAA